MVDIAAQLSLIPSSPALDPAAILGAETADTEAFGNILASQIQGKAGTGAPASPLPPLPIPAGIRQPAGKILPGAAQILPDAGIATVEAPALLAAPVSAKATAAQLVSTGLAAKLAVSVPQPPRSEQLADQPSDPTTPEAMEAAVAQRAEASPVHGLLKMLAAALKGQGSDAAGEPAADQVSKEGESAEQSPSDAASVRSELALTVTLPIVQLAGTPQPTEAQLAQSAETGRATPVLLAAAPAAGVPIAPQAAEVQSSAGQPSRTPTAEAQAATVLTVPNARPDGTVPAVTLEAAPISVAGKAVTARIELASVQAQADAPLSAERAAAVARTAVTDRTKHTEGAGVEAAPAPLQPLAAEGRPQTTGLPAAAGAAAPGIEMPRQDFAALVERLIEARNAGTAQSSHASVRHAEFGQVSLQFQQEGKDLSVSMRSADPEFAVAVQAAMPAERQASADTASRNQSQGQSQSQSAGNSAASQQDAAGQRGEAGDQQGRHGRNSRGGANPGNPSQRWADNGQAQSRSGIFA